MPELAQDGAGEPAAGRGWLIEALAAAFLSATFFWGLRFLLIFAVAFIPAAALPLVRFGYRRGVAAVLAAGGAGAILAGGFALLLGQKGPDAFSEAVIYLATAGVCGVAGAAARSRSASAVFLGLCLYGAAAVAGFSVAGPPEGAQIGRQFDAYSKTWLDSSRQSGADPDTLKALQGALESARAISINYAPGLAVMLWILLAAVAFFLGLRLGRDGSPGWDFSGFRLPPHLAAAFVVSGAAAALWQGDGRRLALDVLGPLLVLYFLAGLSIIAFFARRWLRTRLFRVALYVLTFCFPFSAATAGLGLFDWYFDVRRRAEKQGDGRSQ
ncbi:MAG: DUF2232 domain-containing protein [Thermoanaerobaculia bacterium]